MANLRPSIKVVVQFTRPEHGLWKNNFLLLRGHISQTMLRTYLGLSYIWWYPFEIWLVYLTCPLRCNTRLLLNMLGKLVPPDGMFKEAGYGWGAGSVGRHLETRSDGAVLDEVRLRAESQLKATFVNSPYIGVVIDWPIRDIHSIRHP